MAKFMPNFSPGSLSPETARMVRALKSLPDEEFIVWHRLSIWNEPGPDFFILSKDQRVAWLKVSTATSRDAAKLSQPELISSRGPGKPLGVAEHDAMESFSRLVKSTSGFGPPRLPARRAYSSEREVKCVISFAGSVQVFRRRRIRFQQAKSTRCVGVAHEMDFP